MDLLVSRVQVIFSLGDGFRQARINHGNFGRGGMRGIIVTSFPTQQLVDVFRVWPQVGKVAIFTILNVEICGFLFLFFLSGFVFEYMGLNFWFGCVQELQLSLALQHSGNVLIPGHVEKRQNPLCHLGVRDGGQGVYPTIFY